MEPIQSNTCEIIQIDQLFINEIKELKQKYLSMKQKIFQEIILLEKDFSMQRLLLQLLAIL